MRSNREYLEKMRWRYARAQRRSYKSRLVEQLVALCGYSRKHAIGLLNGRGGPRLLKRSGPKPVYPPNQLRLVLERIWFGSDQLCGKRLQAALPEWLPHTRKNTARSLCRLKRSWQTSAPRLAQRSGYRHVI
jgi:hypothetical protein